MNKESRIAIFASGNGSNAEAIISYFAQHESIAMKIEWSTGFLWLIVSSRERFHIRETSDTHRCDGCFGAARYHDADRSDR